MWDYVALFLRETKTDELVSVYKKIEDILMDLHVDAHHDEIKNALSTLENSGKDYVYEWIQSIYQEIVKRVLKEYGIVYFIEDWETLMKSIPLLKTLKDLEWSDKYEQLIELTEEGDNSYILAAWMNFLNGVPFEESLPSIQYVSAEFVERVKVELNTKLEVLEMDLSIDGLRDNKASLITNVPFYRGSFGHKLMLSGVKSGYDLYTYLDRYIEEESLEDDAIKIAENITVIALLSSTPIEEWAVEQEGYLSEAIEDTETMLAVNLHANKLLSEVESHGVL